MNIQPLLQHEMAPFLVGFALIIFIRLATKRYTLSRYSSKGKKEENWPLIIAVAVSLAAILFLGPGTAEFWAANLAHRLLMATAAVVILLSALWRFSKGLR